MAPKVLMVAEKPSIALSIATVLSGGRMSSRRGSTEVHEFEGTFMGMHAFYKVTSVIGHVFSVDFPAAFQDWKATDPLDLFQAPIQKMESNPKAHIRRHLNQEARGCSHLVLWLDCDREGENICFEVLWMTRVMHAEYYKPITKQDELQNTVLIPDKQKLLKLLKDGQSFQLY